MEQFQKTSELKDCSFGKNCGACDDWTHSYNHQLGEKQKHLSNLATNIAQINQSPLPNIDVLSLGDRGLRDRLELSYDQASTSWGFYDKLEPNKVLPVNECLMLSPPLAKLFSEFQDFTLKNKFPFTKANLRLRVCYSLLTPKAFQSLKRGIWFDLPNISIKELLEEKVYLSELLKIVDIIELGQKRKILTRAGKDFKLKDPEANHWFNSYVDDQEIPLHTSVGAFTQPSLLANQLICKTIQNWISGIKIKTAVEFGSGCGNLSFALAKFVEHLLCLELDALSIKGMNRSLEYLKQESADFNPDKFKIWQGDFQRLRSDLKDKFLIDQTDIVFVNPPRSGLKEFTETILELNPKYVFYMSCYPESFQTDCEKLFRQNYKFKKIALLDQFPHTKHYEILCLLEQDS